MYFIKNPEGRIKNLNKLIKNSYIQYSTSVILQRSIPNVKDGLKPVQRRVLYAMYKEKMHSNRGFEKSAGVVGEVLKNYHPHGDTSVYDSLVRLGQSWAIRYPLIDPQGNFGSLDGDSPAAYRYTECRLSRVAEELLVDIPNNTVNFVLNYKKNLREPETLPSLIPNLLLNGSYGIAVGVTTNIPPHNINEVLLACIKVAPLKGFTKRSVFRILGGPDFPLKSVVLAEGNPFSYFFNWSGCLTFKGCLTIKTLNFGKYFYFKIVVESLPYNVNRNSFLVKLSSLIKDRKLSDVLYLKDNSSQNTRIVLFLKKNTLPVKTLSVIYEYAGFESSSSVKMLALHKKKPTHINVLSILKIHINYRVEVLKKKFISKVKNLKLRANLLKGLKIMFNRIIQAFKAVSFLNSKKDLNIFLMKKYGLKGTQIDFILNLKLIQTSNKEKLRILEEYRVLKKNIFKHVISIYSFLKIKNTLIGEFLFLLNKYKSRRRSLIVKRGLQDVLLLEKLPSIEVSKEVLLFITKDKCFLLKHLKPFYENTIQDNQYLNIKGGLFNVVKLNLYKHLFVVTGDGYTILLRDIVENVDSFKSFLTKNTLKFYFSAIKKVLVNMRFIVVTKNGRALRQNLSYSKNLKVKAVNLDCDDEVADCLLINDQVESIAVFTHLGRCIRTNIFNLKNYTGKAKGLKCLSLFKYDSVVSIVGVNESEYALLVYENGYVKKTPFKVFKLQKRSGKGVRCSSEENKLKGCLSVKNEEDVLISTLSGKNHIFKCSFIKLSGRKCRGVRLVKLKNLDKIISIIKI